MFHSTPLLRCTGCVSHHQTIVVQVLKEDHKGKCHFCYMPRAHFNRMACHCGWMEILTTGLRRYWLSLFVKLLGLSISLLFHFDSGRMSLGIAHSERVGKPATLSQLWGGDRNLRRKELYEVFRSPECGLEWDCGTADPILSPWFCGLRMSGLDIPPCYHDTPYRVPKTAKQG